MVTVRPDCVPQMAGDPPIFATGCLGRIEQAEEQPDGTFRRVLRGVSRFLFLQEIERTGDRAIADRLGCADRRAFDHKLSVNHRDVGVDGGRQSLGEILDGLRPDRSGAVPRRPLTSPL